MTVEINAPDEGAYENYTRYVTISDSNKEIEFSADRIEKNVGGFGADRITLKEGEFYRVRLTHMEDGWHISPMLREEDADKFSAKISKEDVKKILKAFDAWSDLR